MSRHIVTYCPHCDSDRLERCFGADRLTPEKEWIRLQIRRAELWGWSDFCLDCGWRGQAPQWRDRWAPVPRHEDEPDEPEPFDRWPNGQGE